MAEHEVSLAGVGTSGRVEGPGEVWPCYPGGVVWVSFGTQQGDYVQLKQRHEGISLAIEKNRPGCREDAVDRESPGEPGLCMHEWKQEWKGENQPENSVEG